MKSRKYNYQNIQQCRTWGRMEIHVIFNARQKAI